MGQRSKHIDKRYFFIKDRIKKEEINVKHCPTEKMIANFLTKPLQGALFRNLREVLMSRASVDSLDINEGQAT